MRQEENLNNLVLRKQREMFQESMSNSAGTFTLNENREFFIQYDKVLLWSFETIITVSIDWWE